MEVVDELIKRLPRNTVPLKPIKQPKKQRNKKHNLSLVLLLSDLQAGHETASFNGRVLRKRMEHLIGKTIELTDLYRTSHNINNLYIFLLGDNIQHERIGALVDLDSLEATVSEQVFDMAIPVLEMAIGELSKHFNNLDIYAVRGNHGGNGKFSAPSTNWDDVIYHFLKERFRKTTHVKWHLTKHFYQLAKVEKLRFMLAHGDQIPTYHNIPIYGVRTRALGWYSSVSKFDVLTIGHFHTYHSWDVGNIHIIINGTFVSDDEYAVRRLGSLSAPCQVLLGVAKNMITFESKIYLP